MAQEKWTFSTGPTRRNVRRILLRGLGSVTGMVAITASLLACASSAEDDEPRSLTIAADGVDTTFDPYVAGGVAFLPIQAFYEPLIILNESTNTFDPWLAKEYSLSEDGHVL